MATAECHFGGGLNSSSGGELKLYLKWKRNTLDSCLYYDFHMKKLMASHLMSMRVGLMVMEDDALF